MLLEPLVSSLLSSTRSGTPNALKTVVRMDSCGVPQREIMIKWENGDFVQPEVRNEKSL